MSETLTLPSDVRPNYENSCWTIGVADRGGMTVKTNDEKQKLHPRPAIEIMPTDEVAEAPIFPVPDETTRNTRPPSMPSKSALAQMVNAREAFAAEVEDRHGRYYQATNSSEAKSITNDTSAQYDRRAKLLLKKYRKEIIAVIDKSEIDSFENVDIVDFIVWLMSFKLVLKAASWRQYRRSVYYALTGLPAEGAEAALSMLDNDIAAVEGRSGSDTDGGERKTSANKAKFFKIADRDMIFEHLRFNVVRKNDPSVLRHWLMAGIAVGLRPLEWRTTSVETFIDSETGKTKIWLFVMNAKTTNMRGNGLMRTIDISELSDEYIYAISRISDLGREWSTKGTYKKNQKANETMLRALCTKVFPRRNRSYCLYSCRHQFIANMKTIYSPEEVAALAGHSVTETAIENYGKKVSGWPLEAIGNPPSPLKSEVSIVRKSVKYYQERAAILGNNKQ